MLTKKGLLGRVWLAAQLGESRIPKQFACEAKIDILCRNIEKPAAPFALRLSAHLMLGVTRVYSRKSTIVLTDVNRVLGALHRLEGDALALISPLSRKRGRISKDNAINITVQGEIEPADGFDQITLPTRKRSRRRSTDTGATSITVPGASDLGHLDASMDQFGRSTSIFGEGVNLIDVHAHLDLEFPTILIGGLEARAGSVDPENILSQSSPRFRAREQDITLPPGTDFLFGSGLHALELDPFEREISLSLDIGRESTPDRPSPPRFDDGSDEFRKAFGQILSSTPRSSSGDGSAAMSVLNPVGPVIEAQLDPLPAIAQDPTSVVDTADPASSNIRGKGEASGRSRRGGRVRKRRSSTGTTRTSRRSLGILSDRLIITDVTELPVQHLRDCLRDTSDIVLPKGAPRPLTRRKKIPEEALESMLMRHNPLDRMLNGRNFWMNIVVKPSFKISESKSSEGAQAGSLSLEDGLSAKKTSLHESPKAAGVNVISKDQAYINMPLAPIDEASMDPFIDAHNEMPSIIVPSISKSGSAADAQSFPSLPSGSGRSGEMSFAQSSSAGSKAPEVLRDLELEEVR